MEEILSERSKTPVSELKPQTIDRFTSRMNIQGPFSPLVERYNVEEKPPVKKVYLVNTSHDNV
ncbi:MAG: hypothetical protein ACJAUP_001457 [Cellvibrionaceae bacterium]|jgi:hypothetical protein